MITPNQSRAARGFLNWTLDDLARASGLSRTSLNNFEQGMGNLKADTFRAIVDAFDRAGVEFTAEPGVRLRGQKIDVRRWEGPSVHQQLLDDIYQTALTQGGEILFSGLDEKTFETMNDNQLLMKKQVLRLRERKIKERVLYREGDRHFTFPPDVTTYRWIEANLFNIAPTITYGNKHAIIVFDPTPIIIVTENAQVAQTYRKQFDVLWAHAKPVPFTAEEIAAMCEKNLPLFA